MATIICRFRAFKCSPRERAKSVTVYSPELDHILQIRRSKVYLFNSKAGDLILFNHDHSPMSLLDRVRTRTDCVSRPRTGRSVNFARVSECALSGPKLVLPLDHDLCDLRVKMTLLGQNPKTDRRVRPGRREAQQQPRLLVAGCRVPWGRRQLTRTGWIFLEIAYPWCPRCNGSALALFLKQWQAHRVTDAGNHGLGWGWPLAPSAHCTDRSAMRPTARIEAPCQLPKLAIMDSG